MAVHKGFKVLNTVAHNLYSFTIADPSQVRVAQPGVWDSVMVAIDREAGQKIRLPEDLRAAVQRLSMR